MGKKRPTVTWLEPLGRPGLMAWSIVRAFALGLTAFFPVTLLATVRHEVTAPIFWTATILGAVVVPLAVLVFDHRSVTIDDRGVVLRGMRGRLPALTTPFATIGRVETRSATRASAADAKTLRLYRSGSGERRRAIEEIAFLESQSGAAIAAAFAARGLRIESAPARGGGEIARLAVASLALIVATVWSVHAVRSARDPNAGAAGYAYDAAALLSIDCVTPAADGSLEVRVRTTGSLVDARVGAQEFERASITVATSPAGESVFTLRPAAANRTAGRFVAVSAKRATGSGVDSVLVPFDPANASPQGSHC